MTRAEAYAKIKEYGLQETIKNHYGFNYTNLSTATLMQEISDYEYALQPKSGSIEVVHYLIDILYKKHIICKSEYEELKSL